MKVRKEDLKEDVKLTLRGFFAFSPVSFIFAVLVLVMGAFGLFKDPENTILLSSSQCVDGLRVAVPLMIVYFVIWYKILSIIVEKDERNKNEKRKERLLRLEVKYADYASLVHDVAEEHFKTYLTVAEDKEYLLKFEDYLNMLSIEKTSSFIVATCLMYSLIDKNNVADSLEFAMECVWKIISEPVLYYYKDGEWLEKKYPKINLILPDNLLNSIKKVIAQEYDVGRTTIMQMANLLHLIYLNSSGR